jgi:hypothetical protein
LESALRTIFESTEYKRQAQSARPPTPIEIAALHQQELDLEAEISALRYGDGPAKVQRLTEDLFRAIESRCREIVAKYDFGIEFGSHFEPNRRSGSCVLKTPEFGFEVRWHRPALNSPQEATLSICEFEGRLYIPGEFQGGAHLQQPRLISEDKIESTISRQHQLGWVKKMTVRNESPFSSNDALAESCISRILNSLRRHHQNR